MFLPQLLQARRLTRYNDYSFSLRAHLINVLHQRFKLTRKTNPWQEAVGDVRCAGWEILKLQRLTQINGLFPCQSVINLTPGQVWDWKIGGEFSILDVILTQAPRLLFYFLNAIPHSLQVID